MSVGEKYVVAKDDVCLNTISNNAPLGIVNELLTPVYVNVIVT
jgi:hypothetical protein